VAVAQALVPLQELMLKHLPAFSAATAPFIGAIANIAAAAAAKATPETFFAVFMFIFPQEINGFKSNLIVDYPCLEASVNDKFQLKRLIFITIL